MKRKNFNNTKDYIEYLIYEKNILNTKNIIILLIIIGTIAIISTQLTNFNSDFYSVEGEQITKETMIETLLQAGYSEEDINNMSEDELNSIFNSILMSNNGQQTGNNKYKEYPEQDAAILKQDYYLKASTGDFNSIISDFEDKKLKYMFSKSYNKELITIYNDAYYLKTIINNTNADKFKISQTLSSIKDPQMLVYGVLLTEEKYRRDTIVDSFSLSPILLNKKVTVTSKFSTSMSSISSLDEKDNRFDEIAKFLNEGNYVFYRFDFTIDNNDLSAYIYKNMSTFELSFYGMYSKSQDNIYLTVYDYMQMEINSSQNNSNTIQTSPSNSTNGDDSFTENNQNEILEEENGNEDTNLNGNEDTNLNNNENNEDIPFEEEIHIN